MSSTLPCLRNSELLGGRSLQSDDLLSEAQTILGQAAGSVEAGLHALVNGLFGPDNTFATKIPDDISNLCTQALLRN